MHEYSCIIGRKEIQALSNELRKVKCFVSVFHFAYLDFIFFSGYTYMPCFMSVVCFMRAVRFPSHSKGI